MIGVLADPSKQEIVREFFELFKTPWEFYSADRKYDVVLCCCHSQPSPRATRLVVSYATGQVASSTRPTHAAASNRYRFPIYEGITPYTGFDEPLLTDQDTGECLAYSRISGETVEVRIGYDLFSEIATLLTTGQPVNYAGIPTLEMHIAFLRDVIVDSGVSLIEIPPVPEGFEFLACLTHDVDHPSIRKHRWDHTVFGFLYRATVGSLLQWVQRKLSFRSLMTNWVAALKLPLVQYALAPDFWSAFVERYLAIEKGRPSTFFFIPFPNLPGKNSQGSAPAFRAARYGVAELTDSIQKLKSSRCEAGLHGIDAWIDADRGRVEIEEIRRLSGASRLGVRMHWLYFDEWSHQKLEDAGADYDSTIGYNDTVGYRAGTTQAYKPLGAQQLIELPLHVMDTALFYPSHLGLTPRQAELRVNQIESDFTRFGGCFTVNWHDRSMAPERLWGAVYGDLLESLTKRGAWFATATQAISWFRMRRSATFERDLTDPAVVRVRIVEQEDQLPALLLRTHGTRELKTAGSHHQRECLDHPLKAVLDVRIDSMAAC